MGAEDTKTLCPPEDTGPLCPPPQPIGPILLLPPLLLLSQELLDMICSHLPQASVCCLAITCKTTFWSVRCKLGMRKKDRSSFLCLLERDLADGFSFCPRCIKLHRFENWWTARNYPYWSRSGRHMCHKMHRADEFFVLEGSWKYVVSYQHLRLVTNSHQFGANTGLPLQSLEATYTVETPIHRRPGNASDLDGLWRHTWSARMIDSELFLRAHHQMQATDEATLRRTLDKTDCYDLCSHVRIDGKWSRVEYPELYSRPEPLGERGPWAACRDVPGSCEDCLTDYVVTIETPDASTPGWRLSVTTYHQLGDGRSAEDWKWRALIGDQSMEGREKPGGRFESWRRDFDMYPPGLVRDAWERDVD